MDRRNFLSLACLVVAGKAVERTFPFRVYSIPKEIVVAKFDVFRELLRYQSAVAMEMSLNGVGLMLDVYSPNSPDFVKRGSFLASISEGRVTGDIPAGTKPGDLVVSDAYGAVGITDIESWALVNRKASDPRTGVFLNLARS